MTIYLASDHAGFSFKEQLHEHLLSLGYVVEDCGAFHKDPEDDYPDFVIPASLKVLENPGSRGIVIGGSGQGEAMAANKVKGVRAAVYYGGSLDIVRLARAHNNATVLSLGARFVSLEEAVEAVHIFLEQPFEQGRHERRVGKLEE
ncbi:MAG: RpiB/LacA/LacB family sugar-phosphate isomerase [bacterium]|nr:RpiB/LacA/LacB family sugar-phosphate isomerase [bacterium]